MQQQDDNTGAKEYQNLPSKEDAFQVDPHRVRVVLVETSHPGNIGAAARAMKTMRLTQLYLVNPVCDFPSAESTARASGADDILGHAVVCRDLEEALNGCSLVIGASARARNLEWPTITPRQCAERIVTEQAKGGSVAVIFGRERSGLSNKELEQCHYRMHIPANPEFSSLNLAAAVQIVAYEIHLASQPQEIPKLEENCEEFATPVEIERFFKHLEETLIDVEFLDQRNPRHLMRRLRRLFARTRLLTTEVNILRGILTAAQRQARLAAKR